MIARLQVYHSSMCVLARVCLPMYKHVLVCKEACACTSVSLNECLCVMVLGGACVHVLVSRRSVTTHMGLWSMCDAVPVPTSG